MYLVIYLWLANYVQSDVWNQYYQVQYNITQVLLDEDEEDDETRLRNIRNRNQLVEKIPRVFLLTNDDDTDVEDVTDVNDEDDVCWKDFLSKEYDDNLFNFFFVLTCRSALLAIVELWGEVCNLDFLLRLSVILSTNSFEL